MASEYRYFEDVSHGSEISKQLFNTGFLWIDVTLNTRLTVYIMQSIKTINSDAILKVGIFIIIWLVMRIANAMCLLYQYWCAAHLSYWWNGCCWMSTLFSFSAAICLMIEIRNERIVTTSDKQLGKCSFACNILSLGKTQDYRELYDTVFHRLCSAY